MKYWEAIADNLKKAGWIYGYVSAIDSRGRIDCGAQRSPRTRAKKALSLKRFERAKTTARYKFAFEPH